MLSLVVFNDKGVSWSVDKSVEIGELAWNFVFLKGSEIVATLGDWNTTCGKDQGLVTSVKDGIVCSREPASS